jgi:GMP synthase-like glutamine amidotransferase
MQRHTSDPYPASTSPIAKSDKQSDNSSSPASSAYDSHPWIARLIDFIRDLITDPRKRDLKVIGICFGMQVRPSRFPVALLADRDVG